MGKTRAKITEFFRQAEFVHESQMRRRETWERRGLSAPGPANGGRGAQGKRDFQTNTFKRIGFAVRDDRRYDRREDEKQKEPIIIKSTHRFLCTRRTKKSRETEGTSHHQVNTYVPR